MNGVQTIIVCLLAATVLPGFAVAQSGYHPNQLIYPDNCSWPDCLAICDACPGQVLSTCTWEFMMSTVFNLTWNSCKDRHGPGASCHVAHCLCDLNFCATQVHPNKWECTPKICHPAGSTPPAHEESFFAKWFLYFGGRDPFPDPDILLSQPIDFLLSLFVPWPICALAAGLVCTCIIVGRLCCRFRIAKLFKEFKAESPKQNIQGESKSLNPQEKPDPWVLIALAVFIVTWTLVLTAAKVINSSHLFNETQNQVIDVYEDASQVAGQIEKLVAHFDDVHTNLSGIVSECEKNFWVIGPALNNWWQTGGNETITPGSRGTPSGDAQYYSQLMRDYNELVQDIPNMLLHILRGLQYWQGLFIWLPHVPPWFLAIFCLFILLYTLKLLYLDRLPKSLSLTMFFNLMASIFALILILFSVMAVVHSVLGIALSRFCMDPEYNTRMYLSLLSNDSLVANVTQYYLEGDVANPLRKPIDVGAKYLRFAEAYYSYFLGPFNWFKSTCIATKDIELNPVIEELWTSLDHARAVVDAHNIWPFYETTVRRVICHNIVDDLALYTLALECLGLFCVPFCAITTHAYFYRWMKYKAWGRQQNVLVNSSDEDSSDEDSSDEDSSDEDTSWSLRLLEMQ